MQVRFEGGPWDKLEFDVDFLPDVIAFRDLLFGEGGLDVIDAENLTIEISGGTSERLHHVYVQDNPILKPGVALKVGETLPHEPEIGQSPLEIVDEKYLIMVYRYEMRGKAWWEPT